MRQADFYGEGNQDVESALELSEGMTGAGRSASKTGHSPLQSCVSYDLTKS